MKKFSVWFILFFAIAFVLLYLIPPADYYGYIAVLVYFSLLLIYLIDIFTNLNREEDNEYVLDNYIKGEEMVKKSGRARAVALPILKCALGAAVIYRLSILYIQRFDGFATVAGIAAAIAVIGALLFLEISGKGFNFKAFGGMKDKKRYAVRKAIILACFTIYVIGAAYLSPLFAE